MTIVILIILAGVVINLTLSENGILQMAHSATQEYSNVQKYEEVVLDNFTNHIESVANSRDMSETDIKKLIQESCVGFPDYANRTELTSGTQYTADANIYVIIDTASNSGNGHVLLSISVNGQSYRFDSEYVGADYGHHSESIIPIKKGDIYTVTFTGCKAYKVSMRY